jgi:hypothetical protein
MRIPTFQRRRLLNIPKTCRQYVPDYTASHMCNTIKPQTPSLTISSLTDIHDVIRTNIYSKGKSPEYTVPLKVCSL